jgi:hypothetical protein
MDGHPLAINILARAIRFMIVSDEVLCEEPRENFDPDMNAEILSKTLISIGHLCTSLSLLQAT